jgi:signal transduction histidine kinase
MKLKIKSIILVALCFITVLAVSYAFLQFLSRDLNAGVATMYAREQVNYNNSQILPALFIARGVAEEPARLRNIFLANMRHEFRTPLNIIIGMNKLLQGMNHSTEQKNYLGKIDFSAKQLLELITDILDLAKISEGKK